MSPIPNDGDYVKGLARRYVSSIVDGWGKLRLKAITDPVGWTVRNTTSMLALGPFQKAIAIRVPGGQHE